MIKPVCVQCQMFYRPERNGIRIVEGKPIENGVPPGKAAADRWLPYKVWIADLWMCQCCGSRIIVGSGRQPLSEDYMPSFEAAVATATHRVNDC